MDINISNGTLTGISTTIVPAQNYALPSSVTVTGATASYNSGTGALTLSTLTGDVVTITASTTTLAPPQLLQVTVGGTTYTVGKVNGNYVNQVNGQNVMCGKQYSVTTSVTNGSATGATFIPIRGTGYTVTIVPSTDYSVPDTVTVNGVTGTSGSTGVTWTYSNGVITLGNPTGDVTISATCESAAWGGTDLTGTTWEITSTTCSAGYGDFSINYALTPGYQDQTRFLVGYTLPERPPMTPIEQANNIMTWASFGLVSIGNVISITDGTDVTNSDLISWLQANATLISW